MHILQHPWGCKLKLSSTKQKNQWTTEYTERDLTTPKTSLTFLWYHSISKSHLAYFTQQIQHIREIYFELIRPLGCVCTSTGPGWSSGLWLSRLSRVLPVCAPQPSLCQLTLSQTVGGYLGNAHPKGYFQYKAPGIHDLGPSIHHNPPTLSH